MNNPLRARTRLARWMWLAAAAIVTVVTSAGAAGPSLDTDQVLAALQHWLEETRELECRFDQTLISGAFGAGLEESGKLYVKRPGRMRWEYTRPESKIAIVRDQEALLYLPEDAQLIRGGEEWTQGLLASLLSGGGRLEELFEATLVATPDHGGSGGYRLRLVPLESTGGFQEVTLDLRPPTFAIGEAEVLDEAGNLMRYRFRSQRRNRGLADDLFVLEPPPGTEIVDPS